MLAEQNRLKEDAARQQFWKRWGPYLSERQWATVREDYSADGSCWNYFPHDHARSRTYRWGEDGLLGITDRQSRLCFAVALWNGKDPFLKERLFGLTNQEGNHGEDVKESYFYLDSTPTHSYMKGLYKYPIEEFPYTRLIEENSRRRLDEPEFELVDTGVFDENRYFDVFVEYAKTAPNDILIRITVNNRSKERAELHVIPTLWFCNSWSWGCKHDDGCTIKPTAQLDRDGLIITTHETLGKYVFSFDTASDGTAATALFTENETNSERLYGVPNNGAYVKDGINDYVVDGKTTTVNPGQFGTKVGLQYLLTIDPEESRTIRLRLSASDNAPVVPFGNTFAQIFAERLKEADEFYNAVIPAHLSEEQKSISRQAYAGLLWNKQYYHFVINDWLNGDPFQPSPPAERKEGRNNEWGHVFARDVISMPDKWEYPWFAAWDLAFHTVPLATIDPCFAKQQLVLLLREWYMHPNGQLPAYEFSFSDVNPPVHAWAAWRVYKIARKLDCPDKIFLESVFHKLLINFTWWVNRKDTEGNNLFSGGFLGLDNIGVFDRSKPLPTGGFLQQADGTAWMAFYCLTMLAIALELAEDNPAYEDMASKFFEHFIGIADAVNTLGGTGLWDEADGFYYDRINFHDDCLPLKSRSLVGLIPLLAVEILQAEKIAKLPGFTKRLNWFLAHRQDLSATTTYFGICPTTGHRILAIPSRERLERLLHYLLSEDEFLSPFGIRSLSRIHATQPYVLPWGNEFPVVSYVPGDANSKLFGGNSNWRGPIWFPINYLIIEALERYHHFYGDSLTVEYPTGSGTRLNLQQVANDLSRRLSAIFMRNPANVRPCHGDNLRHSVDPHWRDLLLFHEFFHGENGRGLGATHQTGWTALVVRLLENC